jgi:hypothetical protein
MWVITHHTNRMHMKQRIDYSEFGNWHTPTYGPTYKGVGPIETVQPSEGDGGVKPWGREFTTPRPKAKKKGP